MDLAKQRTRFDGQSFAQLLGIEFVDAKPGFAQLRMPVQQKHLSAAETVHGGILATVADASCAQALWPMLEDNESFASIELKINYLSPARLHDVLIGEGRIIQRGGRIAVGDMEIREERSKRVILKGLHTFMISKR